jgi:hypothetical protein
MSKNRHAVALGRKGGLRGGKARWRGVSREERRDFARKGGLASARSRKKRHRV